MQNIAKQCCLMLVLVAHVTKLNLVQCCLTSGDALVGVCLNPLAEPACLGRPNSPPEGYERWGSDWLKCRPFGLRAVRSTCGRRYPQK